MIIKSAIEETTKLNSGGFGEGGREVDVETNVEAMALLVFAHPAFAWHLFEGSWTMYGSRYDGMEVRGMVRERPSRVMRSIGLQSIASAKLSS